MKTFCIYRDNNLFSKYVPQLLEEGFEIVGTFIVPAGTDYDSVEEEAIVALKSMQGKGVKIIITDDTFWKVARNHRPSGELVSLNYLFASQTREIVPEAASPEQLITWFAQQLTSGHAPRRVIVVKDCICDHKYISYELMDELMGDDERAGWIIKHFESIFPEAEFSIVAKLDDALSCANDAETLLVADRHCGIKDIMRKERGWYDSLNNWPYACRLYQLPLETCMENLISVGLTDFRFDVQKMRESIINY